MTEQNFPYEIIDEYVRGGCSIIYRIKPKSGTSIEGTQPLVLKTMIPDDDDPAGEKRFYMEYEFLRAYPHENLIKVLDYFPSWRGNPSYVMEWVEGDTWQTFWNEKDMMENLGLFFSVLQQLCSVLDFIHKHQIIHRDLKPQNILITQSNQLKLIDFGIMKVQDLSLFTNRNSFMGSAYYVAPECLSGDDVSHAADIFSLGVMIYDLITGVKPFRGHTLAETVYQRLVSVPKAPSSINRDLPPELDAYFERILHLEPHKRQNSCQEVYDELHAILGKHIPHQKELVEETELDICTQSQFLHTHFLEECLPILEKNRVLYVTGTSGSGKDTLVENIPQFFPIDLTIKTDIHESLTQNDLIEMVLVQTGPPEDADERLRHSLSILATALPQLGWKVPKVQYQIHKSSVLSSFLQILQHFRRRALILLTCVEPPSNELLQFLNHFFFFLKRECSAPFYTVFTSEAKIERLASIIPPKELPFPDVVTLSDYISGQFNQARVPLDVTNRIGSESGNHLGTFLRLVDQHKINGHLASADGVVSLEEDPNLKTTVVAIQNTIPGELSAFSSDQLKHLEWLALNPEGVDINVLKQLTQVNLETLSKTLTIAKENDLLDFKTGSTQGLIWKKKRVREFLLKTLDQEERSSRSQILAKTIEEVSQPYLNFSPPLWRILANLFKQGQDFTAASEYALRYSRYCFQSAQFEAIRLTLSGFEDLPSLQSNHEFWFFLAMAFRNKDAKRARSYASKALEIEDSTQSLALLAIIDFDLGDYKSSKNVIETMFAKEEDLNLDINIGTELVQLLVANNQLERAQNLLKTYEERLRQNDDPYGRNLICYATLQIKERKPQDALAFYEDLQTDFLQNTQIRINQLAILCHVSMFQFEKGWEAINQLVVNSGRATDQARFKFQQELFFLLAFHQWKQVRRLLASDQAGRPENEPLFKLASQYMTGDPQIYETGYIKRTLAEARLPISNWLPLFGSIMNPSRLSSGLVNEILDRTQNTLPYWCRHQTARFEVIKKWVEGDFRDIPTYLHMAVKYVTKYGLVMESLRLERLQDQLMSEGILGDRIPSSVHEVVMDQAETFHFLGPLPQ